MKTTLAILALSLFAATAQAESYSCHPIQGGDGFVKFTIEGDQVKNLVAGDPTEGDSYDVSFLGMRLENGDVYGREIVKDAALKPAVERETITITLNGAESVVERKYLDNVKSAIYNCTVK